MVEEKVKEVLCWSCIHPLSVPGSAHIACAWKRGGRHKVWFYEGFNPNYPVLIYECEGYEKK